VSEAGSYRQGLEGRLDGAGLRFALVAARFHAPVTETLLERCLGGLREHGVAAGDIEIVRVPGAWELPQAVARLARAGRHDALVALGCVIRGETPHFDFVAGEAARGLAGIGARGECPVLFGVLTTDTEAQATERAHPDGQDKGREIALAALEMALLYRDIP
jgi:6,7-dimethyl-8-ribityllumazine synthase